MALEDFSVFEQVRATASRKARLQFGLPSSLQQAIPIELAIVGPLWLLICPAKPSQAWAAIVLQAAALAVMGAALVYFRRMGSRPLEIGWRIALFAQMIGVLDSFTVEPGLPAGTIGVLAGALWVVGGLGVVWGLHIDGVRRSADIGRLKRAGEARRRAHRRFVDLVDTIEGVVWEASVKPFEIHFVSRKASALLGFAPETWTQQPNLWFERIHRDDRDRVLRMVAEKTRKLETYRVDYRLITADGRSVWVKDLVNVVKDADGAVKLRGVTVDVTETKQLEHRLRHDAHHDTLTGLPNRTAFTEALDRAFRNAGARSTFAVLFLDLDRFKLVNDTLGHSAGDAILKETAARIGRAVRSRDVVARLGGDEFAVLAENLSSDDEAVELANRLRQELNRPVEVEGRGFALSASVGIKLAGRSGDAPAEILRDADTAMYCAKENARGSQRVFEHQMHNRLVESMNTEGEIRASIEGGRLELRYRPIVHLNDGSLFGFEAVLHQRDSKGRLIKLDDCAAIAEQAGLAPRLGWSCLHQSLLTSAEPDAGELQIVVPLLAALFNQTDLLEQLDSEVRDTAAKTERLILAVSERAAASPDAGTRLRGLRERGFRIALANFGAGRASLNQLCRLPLSFARVALTPPMAGSSQTAEAAILQAMAKLCAELDIEMIADGVTAHEQTATLRNLGCRLGQGLFYGARRGPQELYRMTTSRQAEQLPR